MTISTCLTQSSKFLYARIILCYLKYFYVNRGKQDDNREKQDDNREKQDDNRITTLFLLAI